MTDKEAQECRLFGQMLCQTVHAQALQRRLDVAAHLEAAARRLRELFTPEPKSIEECHQRWAQLMRDLGLESAFLTWLRAGGYVVPTISASAKGVN